MKIIHYIAILALLSLVSCVSQRHNEVGEPDIATFYPYNPADTIGNPYYHNLLMVDSTRVYYKNLRESEPSLNFNEYEDSLYAAQAKNWLSIMDLASKKKWKECLHLYEKNHMLLYYVLENSQIMFNADYHVFSEIMYDYYPETEANENNLKLFEEDYWITSYAIYSDDDYLPDHYEELTRNLGCLYAEVNNREMAFEFAEIYKDVLTYFYDDENDVNLLYLNNISEIYLTLKDYDNALKSLYSYRDCVIRSIDDENVKANYLFQIDNIIERTRQKNIKQ